jgi:hypothetical protein
MKSPAHSNSLAVLAARITKRHKASLIGVRRSLTHAIRCGELLLQAKAHIKEQYGHGHWLPWLKKSCAIPERTAQLYMRLAKTEIRNVANLSLRAAVKLLTEKPGLDGDDEGNYYWITPPDLMAKLNAEFGPFDFDPAPFPRPKGFNGLRCDWGKSNYVNVPFTGGITAWARKALAEHSKGNLIVMVFPVDGWLLSMLKAGAIVRDLGKVKWISAEDNHVSRAPARPIALFVLDPRKREL